VLMDKQGLSGFQVRFSANKILGCFIDIYQTDSL
jgi:hypothetical protein